MKTGAILWAAMLWALVPPTQAADLEDVSIRSKDGSPIFGALRTPDGDGPFPALLILHGGAGGARPQAVRDLASPQSSSPTIRAFAQRDWVLLSADYRGRALFGREEDDAFAALEYLRGLPQVDQDRVAVWGGSHGGHLALRVAEQAPAAIVAVATGSAWITDPILYFYGDLDKPPLVNLSEESRGNIANRRRLSLHLLPESAQVEPEALLKRLHERSILENAGAITAPSLFLTSRGDAIVPHAMIEPLIEKLRGLGREVSVYTAEQSGHGFYLTGQGKEAEEARKRLLEFLDRRLGGKAP